MAGNKLMIKSFYTITYHTLAIIRRSLILMEVLPNYLINLNSAAQSSFIGLIFNLFSPLQGNVLFPIFINLKNACR